MNIPDAIKQLGELKECCNQFAAVEIMQEDKDAIDIALELLKEKSVSNQVKVNKEIMRQRNKAIIKRTTKEVQVQEPLKNRSINVKHKFRLQKMNQNF